MHLPVLLLSRSRRRIQRGQAIVLGSLSFLVLALMVTLSFNLSHALRQKMSLQQHSDTLSFSMAVLEARALNYYAVSNRAIATSYVAMNSLHAYMSAASLTGEMMRASSNNFMQIALIEFGLCVACEFMCDHCEHIAEAIQIANDFSDAGDDYDDKVKDFESNFNTAMEGLDLMVDNIHTAQRSVHDKTLQAVKDGRSHGLSQLKSYTAPNASELVSAVGSINANEFNCAVDGMECQGSESNSSPEARARVMTEIANATRSGWPATRTSPGMGSPMNKPKYLNAQFFQEMDDIPNNEAQKMINGTRGTAKTVKDNGQLTQGGQEGGNEGSMVAAQDEGNITHQWKHGFGFSSFKSEIWSDDSGGDHKGDGAHSGQHRFEGVNVRALTGCAGSGNCFMKFRANPDPDRDWGQPRVYSYLSMRFRVGDTKRAPWELNSSAQVKLTHGQQGDGNLTVAATEGMAMSKSLVYYHRFGDDGWKEAPNLFAPYWRAKLHPYTKGDAQQVLEAAGNSEAAQMSQVEGVAL
ncbi:hypothetical protein HUA74_11775 [Myxococcus sp. CA051A]|uniref:hypothetical protein n=1 Tax=unclassified Myxococcus TaxID=2648731 RepID=UPI00157A7791|nr:MULTISPECIES: hypothetical protein [unclassified Myxococcus]NTX09235.1 hypothetical protein [Myxococcus sp. CA056]NTX39756.1 hypothetical protein [Myxococcus sp. CA033]NTX57584.1 hypothetical protein [Myxococcus sp. CA039A]NTX61346.1 hypothetical protein [Myxococcus sp. CA051A]